MTAATRTGRGSLATMLRMQFRVEQRIFWRNRSGVFFTFVLPLVLLVSFGFSRDTMDAAPFIVALAVLSTGFQGLSIQLSMHRDQGVLKRLMATPLPPWVLVAAKAMSITAVVLIELAVITAVSVFGFGADAPDAPLVLLAFVLLGTATFVSMGFALASLISTSDSAPAISNAAYLGLLGITALVENVDMPRPLYEAGRLLPLSRLVDPIEGAWNGGAHGSWWVSAAVLAAWGAAAVTYTVRRFRWEPAGEG